MEPGYYIYNFDKSFLIMYIKPHRETKLNVIGIVIETIERSNTEIGSKTIFPCDWLHKLCTRIVDQEEIERLDKKRLLMGI